MSHEDAIAMKFGAYATKCQSCRDLYARGVEYVRDMALVRDGVLHLYRNSDVPLCSEHPGVGECDDPAAVKHWVREYFRISDIPCEPSGNWPHVHELLEVENKLRAMVGAPLRKLNE